MNRLIQRGLCSLFVATALLPVAAFGGVNRWSSHGPDGDEEFIALAIDPLTSSTLYADSPPHGLFRSTNGGERWMPVGVEKIDIYRLLVDPKASSTLYAIAYEQQPVLVRSTDAGSTWERIDAGLPSPASIFLMAIDPSNSSVLYAGLDRDGVFKSIDAGRSWKAINTGLPPIVFPRELAIDRSSSTLYLVIDYADTGLFRSTDGGSTWAAANAGLTSPYLRALCVDPSNAGVAYVMASGDGLFKTADGGASWKQINRALATSYVENLVVDPARPSTLYATSVGSGVLKSTDGGETWAPATQGLTSLIIRSLLVDPSTPSTLYASAYFGGGGGGAVFKSTDAGGSWRAINSGLTRAAVFALDLVPSVPPMVLAGTRRGPFRSTDGGRDWTEERRGLTDATVVSFAVAPGSPPTIYATAAFYGVAKSTDQGQSWEPANSGIPLLGAGFRMGPIDVAPSFSSALYVFVSYLSFIESPPLPWDLYRSTNAGRTWSKAGSQSAPFQVVAMAVDPSDPMTVFAGSSSQGIFRSKDAGASWESVGLGGMTVWSLKADPSSSTLYAGASSGVWKSLDRGTTWTPASAGLKPGEPVYALAIDPTTPRTLYAGTSSGVFRSDDGGASWLTFGSGLPGTTVTALAVAPDGVSVHAGTALGAFDYEALSRRPRPQPRTLPFRASD